MIRAILFDKDGTLTDFRATWEPWMAGMIHELADASGADPEGIAEDFGFDLETGTIPPHARFVTAPGYVTVDLVARRIGWDRPRLSGWLGPRSSSVSQVVVPGAVAVLHRLATAGFTIGVLTNADEAEARRHLDHMGAQTAVSRIIGHDSGFGAKPDPKGAANFADALNLAREEVLLVGDGMTDMEAARGAGLPAVGVLTGTLDRAALAPHARAVLPDVTHLPDWLAKQATSAA
ncbi:phosphoglycolate phosphatase [Jannaschia faecimaris]|uniref:phosphoglycolate phosphatase n=1 Tax=Jannaschia faecimaris TaxID=1244108 RepID=A0A1H3QMY4_9RHOB|nr:HAD family hydrolase [Jannaschia faecimaris]SDZ14461.1 phosphoglycolate phosphatase [Jannaschia faecimaris]